MPLALAHVGHHRHDSNEEDNFAAEAQIQRDVSAIPEVPPVPADPEDIYHVTPEKPLKKSLGKRKASDSQVEPSKKRKRKSKADGTLALQKVWFYIWFRRQPSLGNSKARVILDGYEIVP
jgi:hypothetical protein